MAPLLDGAKTPSVPWLLPARALAAVSAHRARPWLGRRAAFGPDQVSVVRCSPRWLPRALEDGRAVPRLPVPEVRVPTGSSRWCCAGAAEIRGASARHGRRVYRIHCTGSTVLLGEQPTEGIAGGKAVLAVEQGPDYRNRTYAASRYLPSRQKHRGKVQAAGFAVGCCFCCCVCCFHPWSAHPGLGATAALHTGTLRAPQRRPFDFSTSRSPSSARPLTTSNTSTAPRPANQAPLFPFSPSSLLFCFLPAEAVVYCLGCRRCDFHKA